MEGAITACAWVKYSGFESHSNILAIGNGHNSDNILLHNHHNTVTSTNTLQWIILRGSVWKSVAVSNILELGKWMHICGAVESTGEMKVYVNGVEQACTAGGTACDNPTGKGTDGWTPNRLHRQQAYMGRSSWSVANGEHFNGSISDVTIVDGQALTAAEVAKQMIASDPTSTSTTTATTATTTSVTIYQPQTCHGVLEAAGCGTRIPIDDCGVGGAHQQFANVHCPVMCGLECTSTTSTATTSTATTITTSSVTTTTTTTSTTTTSTATTITHTSTSPTTSTPTTAASSSTTSTWLDVHALCDPLEDVCNRAKGLVCGSSTYPYTCRYVASEKSSDGGDGGDGDGEDADEDGGSGNGALYACIGVIAALVLAGVVATGLRNRAGGDVHGTTPAVLNSRAITSANNPTFVGDTAEAQVYESSYEDMGVFGTKPGVVAAAAAANNVYDTGVPAGPSTTQEQSADATYEEVLGNLGNQFIAGNGSATNDDGTYEDVDESNADGDVNC